MTPTTPSGSRAALHARTTARLLLVLPAVGMLAGLLASPLPADAATATLSCRDGGKVTWKSKVVWGNPYKSADGVTRIRVDVAGWTTTRAGKVPTDSIVKSYNGAGRLLQTLTRTARFDYRSGTRYDARNPMNPQSAPGKAKITVTTGVDGDGKGDCTSTFTQPKTAAVPTPSQPATTGKVPRIGKSKLPWNSIVFGHGANPGGFESWRDRPVDGVLYFPARNSWSDMGQLPSRRADDLMVYSIPPFPEGVDGSNAKVAAGNYDANIRSLAAKMRTAGWNTNRTVIRLGWENNGNWYQWGQDRGGSAAFKGSYRRFVTQARAAGLTNVKWDWNLNKGPQSYNAGVSWTTGYPGDDVVDVIGLDAYDMWNPSFTDSQWDANMLRRNPGLQEVADFVRSHKKQMALDEWGVVHDAHGGKDNPFYIKKMFGFVKANADILAWENTYDDDGAPSQFNHKLSDGGNPKAAAQYRKSYPDGWGG